MFNDDPTYTLDGPEIVLARKILNGVLPVNCVRSENPTDTPGPELDAVPAVSALYPNVPNPVNPTTRIEFDLARGGHVRLQIHDASGKLVRTLVDWPRVHGFKRAATWNGLDEPGRRVASGVYLYRLEAGEFAATRKLVLLK